MTYRISHHSTSDDSFAYRSKREVEDWKRKDNPIVRMRKWMENKGWWSDEKEAELKSSVKKRVLKEFSKAEKLKRAGSRISLKTRTMSSTTGWSSNARSSARFWIRILRILIYQCLKTEEMGWAISSHVVVT